jgi:nodulation protein E
MTRRVVVTGMGAVSAAGFGVAPLWQACLDGRSGVGLLDAPGFAASRVKIAAQVTGLDIAALFPPALANTLDRFSALALLAADEALAQAGLAGPLGERCAVILGTGVGGSVTMDAGSQAFYLGDRRPDPMSVPKIMPSAATSHVSMRFGVRGPSFAVSSACASSAQAIGLGLQMVQAGMVDRAIVGGSEAMLIPPVMRAWEMLRVLSPQASRPFSDGRDGMVLGEGSGILVIEAAEMARGVPIVELAGYGTSSDANDLLRPDPVGAARAMELALADAGLTAAEIGYVNAHGTGTVLNDASETAALRSVFRERLVSVPVSSTKPVHGHTIGAAGAIELIVSISALLAQIVPPTINYLRPDPNCDLDAVPNQAKSATFSAALSNSFAFGGINASLVVRAF